MLRAAFIILFGLLPAQAQEAPSSAPGTTHLAQLLFTGTSTTLPAPAQPVLNGLVARLAPEDTTLLLVAYANPPREGAHPWRARRIALARALSVRNYLVLQGAPVERIFIAPKGTAEHAPSERVDIFLATPAGAGNKKDTGAK